MYYVLSGQLWSFSMTHQQVRLMYVEGTKSKDAGFSTGSSFILCMTKGRKNPVIKGTNTRELARAWNTHWKHYEIIINWKYLSYLVASLPIFWAYIACLPAWKSFMGVYAYERLSFIVASVGIHACLNYMDLSWVQMSRNINYQLLRKCLGDTFYIFFLTLAISFFFFSYSNILQTSFSCTHIKIR